MEVLEQTLDSREVAKMVGMRHDNLLQKINSYIKYLRKDAALKNKVGEYFIQSEYFDDNSQLRRCFQVSKKGCDMIANKLSRVKKVFCLPQDISRYLHQWRPILNNKNNCRNHQETN